MTQLFGFSEREMNHPLALCELAARAPNISAGHRAKQACLQNDRVFILDCSLTGADERCPRRLKQRKSPLDHPFRSIDDETRKLSYKLILNVGMNDGILD